MQTHRKLIANTRQTKSKQKKLAIVPFGTILIISSIRHFWGEYMQAKSQRKIIQETSQRFNSLVQAGAKNDIAYNFYLASLRLDLKAANRQPNQKV